MGKADISWGEMVLYAMVEGKLQFFKIFCKKQLTFLFHSYIIAIVDGVKR